jgi:hypothetical protein
VERERERGRGEVGAVPRPPSRGRGKGFGHSLPAATAPLFESHQFVCSLSCLSIALYSLSSYSPRLTDADRRRMADTFPSEPRRREEGGRKGVTWVPPAVRPAEAPPASATLAGGSPAPPLRAGVRPAAPPVEADRPRRRDPLAPPPVAAVPAVAAGAGAPVGADGGRPAEPVAADAARRRRVDTPGVGSAKGRC